MQGTFVSWTQTTAIQSFSVFWCTHAAIKRLPVVNTSPLHMQSTHGATHNKPDCKKKRKRGERERGKKCKPSFISQTALKLCFVSPWSAIIPVCMSQTVGVGVGEGGGVWVWGDTRTRTFEKPFHTAWSGDMDPMRQRRGTRYFKVT